MEQVQLLLMASRWCLQPGQQLLTACQWIGANDGSLLGQSCRCDIRCQDLACTLRGIKLCAHGIAKHRTWYTHLHRCHGVERPDLRLPAAWLRTPCMQLTVPYLIMVVKIINYWREIVITTVITSQYTVQTIFTYRKLQCRP